MDQDAIALLRHATDYLSSMKQLRVDTDTTIEVVLPNGQKLQYGHRVVVTVQRPNKMRAERVGELINQTFYYDGKTLEREPSRPEVLRDGRRRRPRSRRCSTSRATSSTSSRPVSDLIYRDAFERLTQGLTSAFVVGKAVVGGVPCDHLAFRNAEVDWQIWIEEGAKPLPRKFVVTSKQMPESPQFVVVMSKWDAAPKLTDATFRFVPPKGSRRIDFTPTASTK